MKIDFARVRAALQGFRFDEVFVEHLNWSNPRQRRPAPFRTPQGDYTRAAIAELAGVAVFEVTAEDGQVPDAKRRAAVHKEVARHHHEHLLIFVDGRRTQSLWSWLKRDDGKEQPRTHLYVKGQPGDLFLTKLDALVFELAEFDPEGRVPIVEVSRRLRAALDVEAVTRKFYADFKGQHLAFVGLIKGVRDRRKRRWYASVLLNRLMFIYFLQKKGFIDGGDLDYLRHRLARSKAAGKDRYFREFLKPLFFEGFAKPAAERPTAAREALGAIPYLNGGLFLPHALERDHPNLDVPDRAFEGLLALFDDYTWNLNDTPGADDKEINPDVLGYIFEKYINQSDDDEARAEKDIHQKSTGAYYTRPEITAWLAEQTLHRRLLDRVNEEDVPGVPGSGPGGAPRRFEDVADLLLHADARLCKRLLDVVLPSFKVLDPACGSGAFLVAALKALLDLYGALTGRAEVLGDEALARHVAAWQAEAHGNLGYFLKRRVITDNLFGVDAMEEATEIAKLRLFLALVASAATLDQLEPLPNVDFNLMAGNSLVGLLHVDDRKFARKGQLLLGRTTYRARVDQKNHLVADYRRSKKHGDDLAEERAVIEGVQREAREDLDGLLLDEFVELGIKHQQPTWDETKGAEGKAVTRPLKPADIAALRPFHWGYEFDEVLNDRDRMGFDVVLANPPWEVFKPNAKEFFQEHSELVTKNNMRVEDFEAEKKKLLADKDVRKAWLEYLARFRHVNDFFRRAPQYKHQDSVVDGKRVGTDLNLYKLFVEQCVNLLRPGGQLGMVVPGSLYNDLGAKELRAMLFDENELRALFGLSNERYLFDGVHHSFKICLFTAARGGKTKEFPAAFRINPREAVDAERLPSFLRDARAHVRLTPAQVRRLSPESLSIMEFRGPLDVTLSERLLEKPPLSADLPGVWRIELCRELHMTDDSGIFLSKPGKHCLPLYEGKMIHQFDAARAEPRYWVAEAQAEEALRPARVRRAEQALAPHTFDEEQREGLSLEHAFYRLAFREVARNTDERSMICAVLPPDVLAGHTLVLHRPVADVLVDGALQEVETLSAGELLYVCALFNSFVIDWMLRQRISAHVSMFYVYQLPMPRLTAKDAAFAPIVERAAKLTCTTAAFDALARAAGLRGHRDGVTDPEARLRLRAELDGLVAHLYGLTEEEFQHVLQSFPVVPEAQRVAAHNAYRDLARGRRR